MRGGAKVLTTLEKLDEDLPNGFHDSRIFRIEMDFEGSTILICMELLVGLPEDEDCERRRPATLIEAEERACVYSAVGLRRLARRPVAASRSISAMRRPSLP